MIGQEKQRDLPPPKGGGTERAEPSRSPYEKLSSNLGVLKALAGKPVNRLRLLLGLNLDIHGLSPDEKQQLEAALAGSRLTPAELFRAAPTGEELAVYKAVRAYTGALTSRPAAAARELGDTLQAGGLDVRAIVERNSLFTQELVNLLGGRQSYRDFLKHVPLVREAKSQTDVAQAAPRFELEDNVRAALAQLLFRFKHYTREKLRGTYARVEELHLPLSQELLSSPQAKHFITTELVAQGLAAKETAEQVYHNLLTLLPRAAGEEPAVEPAAVAGISAPEAPGEEWTEQQAADINSWMEPEEQERHKRSGVRPASEPTPGAAAPDEGYFPAEELIVEETPAAEIAAAPAADKGAFAFAEAGIAEVERDREREAAEVARLRELGEGNAAALVDKLLLVLGTVYEQDRELHGPTLGGRLTEIFPIPAKRAEAVEKLLAGAAAQPNLEAALIVALADIPESRATVEKVINAKYEDIKRGHDHVFAVINRDTEKSTLYRMFDLELGQLNYAYKKLGKSKEQRLATTFCVQEAICRLLINRLDRKLLQFKALEGIVAEFNRDPGSLPKYLKSHGLRLYRERLAGKARGIRRVERLHGELLGGEAAEEEGEVQPGVKTERTMAEERFVNPGLLYLQTALQGSAHTLDEFRAAVPTGAEWEALSVGGPAAPTPPARVLGEKRKGGSAPTEVKATSAAAEPPAPPAIDLEAVFGPEVELSPEEQVIVSEAAAALAGPGERTARRAGAEEPVFAAPAQTPAETKTVDKASLLREKIGQGLRARLDRLVEVFSRADITPQSFHDYLLTEAADGNRLALPFDRQFVNLPQRQGRTAVEYLQLRLGERYELFQTSLPTADEYEQVRALTRTLGQIGQTLETRAAVRGQLATPKAERTLARRSEAFPATTLAERTRNMLLNREKFGRLKSAADWEKILEDALKDFPTPAEADAFLVDFLPYLLKIDRGWVRDALVPLIQDNAARDRALDNLYAAEDKERGARYEQAAADFVAKYRAGRVKTRADFDELFNTVLEPEWVDSALTAIIPDLAEKNLTLAKELATLASVQSSRADLERAVAAVAEEKRGGVAWRLKEIWERIKGAARPAAKTETATAAARPVIPEYRRGRDALVAQAVTWAVNKFRALSGDAAGLAQFRSELLARAVAVNVRLSKEYVARDRSAAKQIENALGDQANQFLNALPTAEEYQRTIDEAVRQRLAARSKGPVLADTSRILRRLAPKPEPAKPVDTEAEWKKLAAASSEPEPPEPAVFTVGRETFRTGNPLYFVAVPETAAAKGKTVKASPDLLFVVGEMVEYKGQSYRVIGRSQDAEVDKQGVVLRSLDGKRQLALNRATTETAVKKSTS